MSSVYNENCSSLFEFFEKVCLLILKEKPSSMTHQLFLHEAVILEIAIEMLISVAKYLS